MPSAMGPMSPPFSRLRVVTPCQLPDTVARHQGRRPDRCAHGMLRKGFDGGIRGARYASTIHPSGTPITQGMEQQALR
jgi:hypothetical protein